MRKIITSNITTLASMPVKSGSLTHIQNAYTELINALAGSLVGKNYGLIGQYAIIGCNNIDTLPDVDIQAGFILYNGTLYEVDAVAFTPGGGQVAVASIATTYYSASNADPVEFTDGNNHNVHEIKKIVFSSGVSGSGIFDYADLNFVQVPSNIQVSYSSGWDAGTGTGCFYKRNRDGLVTVSGTVYANGTPTLTDPLFSLPIGYRPPVDLDLPCIVQNSGSAVQYGANCFISSLNGRVTVYCGEIGVTFANDDNVLINLSFYTS